MEELYELANEYYTKIESFDGLRPFKTVIFWVFIISAPLFMGSFFYFLYETSLEGNRSLFTLSFAVSLLSELVMLTSWAKLIQWKRKGVLKKLSIEFNETFNDIKSARVLLLEKYFSCSKFEFSSVAVQIEKMLNLACEYSQDKSLIEQFFNFIYNRDAHTRVLTLFVVFSSIITALSISSGLNLTSLYNSYADSSWSSILYVHFIMLILVLVLGYGIIQLFTISKDLLTFLKLSFSFEQSRHIEAVRYLIRDLNNHHAFEKTDASKIVMPIMKH